LPAERYLSSVSRLSCRYSGTAVQVQYISTHVQWCTVKAVRIPSTQ
jgi:hypothetical protein